MQFSYKSSSPKDCLNQALRAGVAGACEPLLQERWCQSLGLPTVGVSRARPRKKDPLPSLTPSRARHAGLEHKGRRRLLTGLGSTIIIE